VVLDTAFIVTKVDVQIRDVKRSSSVQILILKFEFEFDLHTFGIRISD